MFTFLYCTCFFYAHWDILHVGGMTYMDEVLRKFFMICRFVIIQLSMFRFKFKSVYSLERNNFLLCSLPSTTVCLSELKFLLCLLLVIV